MVKGNATHVADRGGEIVNTRFWLIPVTLSHKRLSVLFFSLQKRT